MQHQSNILTFSIIGVTTRNNQKYNFASYYVTDITFEWISLKFLYSLVLWILKKSKSSQHFFDQIISPPHFFWKPFQINQLNKFSVTFSLQLCVPLTDLSILHCFFGLFQKYFQIQGDFFSHWYPHKKYGNPKLGEVMLM